MCQGYRLEAIKPLETAIPYQNSAELLVRDPIPVSLGEWRHWYARLPALTRELCQRHDLASVHVNICTWQLLDAEILTSLREFDPDLTALEWVEDLDPNLEDGAEVLRDLRRLGYRVVFDDVGAGEDMMRRVAAMDPDEVKISGHMLMRARRSSRLQDYLAHQVEFFHKFGWLVTVEWVETAQDLALAGRIGADRVQGYFYAPVEDYTARVIQKRAVGE